ncbi:hypothetical protein C9374_004795 [Naegleria lovaniensis]|uniref:phospholipase D n=1 Tax=Naegleria lovaniensis TaxID=51637 RepID=A0AA88GRJ0_NAELO|nr:uncharacterized protein C9374_004795 [Naegleria lovaniensis]KAG2382828.1 hypothetical protein C9374_004795 [Naegleria lovaniensis]
MGHKHSKHANTSFAASSQQQLSPNALYTPTTQGTERVEHIHDEEDNLQDLLPRNLLESMKQQAKDGRYVLNNNKPPQDQQQAKPIPPVQVSGIMVGGDRTGLGTASTPSTTGTPRKTTGFSSSTASRSIGASHSQNLNAMNRTKYRMEKDLYFKSCLSLDEFRLFKGIFLSFCHSCFLQHAHMHSSTSSQGLLSSRSRTSSENVAANFNRARRDSVVSTISNASTMTTQSQQVTGATPGRTILRNALLSSSVPYYDIHQLFLTQQECQQLLFQHGKAFYSPSLSKSSSGQSKAGQHAHYQVPPSTQNISAFTESHPLHNVTTNDSKKNQPTSTSSVDSPSFSSQLSPPQITLNSQQMQTPSTILPHTGSGIHLRNVEDIEMDHLEKFLFESIFRGVSDCHYLHLPHQPDTYILSFQRFILSISAAATSVRDGQIFNQKLSRLSMSTVFSDDSPEMEEHEQVKKEYLLKERSNMVFTMLDVDRDDWLSREDILTFMIALDRLGILTLRRSKGMLASARKFMFTPRESMTESSVDGWSDGGTSPVSEKVKSKRPLKEDHEEKPQVFTSSLITNAMTQSKDEYEELSLENMSPQEKFKQFETLVDHFFDFAYNQRKNTSLLHLKTSTSLTISRAEFLDISQQYDDVFLNGMGMFETFIQPIMKPVYDFLSKSKDPYEISGKLKNLYSNATYYCEVKGSMLFLYDVDPSSIDSENSTENQSKCIDTIDLRNVVKVMNDTADYSTPMSPAFTSRPHHHANNDKKSKKPSLLVNSRASGDGDEIMFNAPMTDVPPSPISPLAYTQTTSSSHDTATTVTNHSTTSSTNSEPIFSFATSSTFSFLSLQSTSQQNASTPTPTAFVSISNTFVSKKYVFAADNPEQKMKWLFTLLMHITQTNDYNNRFHSFAPERDNMKLKWYVDGKDAFKDIAIAMARAKDEIFIADWLLSPMLYLIRGDNSRSAESRLDILLKNKAAQGVKIYIIMWKETSVAGLNLDTRQTKKYLRSLYPKNIHVCSHPKKFPLTYAHHQKIVVVDQSVAFIGGLDLAYGRYDDHNHSLVDDNHTCLKYPFCDYMNPNIFPLTKFEDKLAHFRDVIDREFVPREPWHDVHCCVSGLLARDVAMNFIERWNHHTKPIPTNALQLKPVQKNPLFEYYKKKAAHHARKESEKKTRRAFGVPLSPFSGYNLSTNVQNAPRLLKQFFTNQPYHPPLTSDTSPPPEGGTTSGIGSSGNKQPRGDDNMPTTPGRLRQFFTPRDAPPPSISNSKEDGDNTTVKSNETTPKKEEHSGGHLKKLKSRFTSTLHNNAAPLSVTTHSEIMDDNNKGSNKSGLNHTHAGSNKLGDDHPSSTHVPPLSRRLTATDRKDGLTTTHKDDSSGGTTHIKEKRKSFNFGTSAKEEANPIIIRAMTPSGDESTAPLSPSITHQHAGHLNRELTLPNLSTSSNAPPPISTSPRIEGVRARTKSWFERHNPTNIMMRRAEREKGTGTNEKEKEEKPPKGSKMAHLRIMNRPTEEYSCPEEEGYVCNAQIVRSLGPWSGATDTEQSIYLAYLHMIEEAQHYIYIENQFFIGGTAGGYVRNAVPLFIARKVIDKMKRGEVFRVYIVMPVHPEGDIAVNSVQQLMKYQYKTINRSTTSLYSIIKQEMPEATDEMIEQYIVFLCLRNYGFMNNNDYVEYAKSKKFYDSDDESDEDDDSDEKIFKGSRKSKHSREEKKGMSSDEYSSEEEDKTGRDTKKKKRTASFVDSIPTGKRAVTELVYVHSKLLIVDDRHCIIGSANINDRSMLGNRDSEIAVVVSDKTFVASRMNGRPYKAGKFAFTLRVRLWKEHLGLFPKNEKTSTKSQHSSSHKDMFDMETGEDPLSRMSMDTTTPDEYRVPPQNAPSTARMAAAKLFHLDRSQTQSQSKTKEELELEEHEKHRIQIEDPIAAETFKLILSTAKSNTEIFEKVFPEVISNRFRTIDEYLQAKNKASTLTGAEKAKEGGPLTTIIGAEPLTKFTSIGETFTNLTPAVLGLKNHVHSNHNDSNGEDQSTTSNTNGNDSNGNHHDDSHHFLSPGMTIRKISHKIHEALNAPNTELKKQMSREFSNQENDENSPSANVGASSGPLAGSSQQRHQQYDNHVMSEAEKRKLLKKVKGFICMFPLHFARDDPFKTTMAIAFSETVDEGMFV